MFRGTVRLFPRVTVPLYVPISNSEGLQNLHILSDHFIVFDLNCHNSSYCEVAPNSGFYFNFLNE